MKQSRDKNGKFLPPTEKWYDSMSIAFWDLEVSALHANLSEFILCWSLKDRDGKIYGDYVTPKEIRNGQFDKRVTKSLLAKLNEFDVWCGYYSTGLDLPYTRSRALYWRYKFPEFGQRYHIDLFYHVRNKLALNRNSLDQATQFFKIPGKTKLNFENWRLAALGYPKAMKELVTHCNGDVIILQQLFEKLEPFCKFNKRSI